MINTNSPKNSWIIDYGDSEHITPHRNWLKSIKENKHGTTVTIPNGETIPITGNDSIQLS